MKLDKIGGVSLPDGFTEVEYIQAPGGQRIDTGVYASASIGLSADFQFDATDLGQNLAQVYSSTYQYQLTVLTLSRLDSPNGSATWFACGYLNTLQYLKKANNYRHIYHFNADGRYTVEMDEIQYEKADPSQTVFPEGALTLQLFVCNSIPMSGYAIMKLYSCAVYDGGRKIRDFKPCLDADGVPCLYDLISGTAFYNQGTGSFTWG